MLGLSVTDRRRWFDAYVRTTVSRDLTGDRFDLGIVLYSGRHPLALSERIVALPLAYLSQL